MMFAVSPMAAQLAALTVLEILLAAVMTVVVILPDAAILVVVDRVSI